MARYLYRPEHPKASAMGFVSEADLGDWQDGETRALDAPILAGRFYENTKAVDGEDIGSRAKHREYMKRHGVVSSSDFSPQWYESRRKEQKREADQNRREKVARMVYQHLKP